MNNIDTFSIENSIEYEKFLISIIEYKQNSLFDRNNIILENENNIISFIKKFFGELLKAVVKFFNKLIELVNKVFTRPVHEAGTTFDISKLKNGLFNKKLNYFKSKGRYIEFGSAYNYDVITDLFVKSAKTFNQAKAIFENTNEDMELVVLTKNKHLLKNDPDTIKEYKLTLLRLQKYYKDLYDPANAYGIDYLLRVNFGIDNNMKIDEYSIENSLVSNKIIISTNNISKYKDIIFNTINSRDKMIKDLRKLCNKAKEFIENARTKAESMYKDSDYQTLLSIYCNCCSKYVTNLEAITTSVIKVSLKAQKECVNVLENFTNFK